MSKMRSRYLILTAVALLLIVGCAGKRDENAPPSVPDIQQAASNALVTMQKIVTKQNYKALGFDSRDEVKTAALAPALPMYNIGLDRLRSYKSGQDANAFLTPSSETIYPVTVAGQVRSSLTIVKKGSGYTTASFGNAEVVKALSRYRRENLSNAFAVRVPALNLYFLGNRIENRLMLTLATEDTRLPFRVGVAVPADEVLKAIVPLARSYNGLPI
jgi:hypothetical protein